MAIPKFFELPQTRLIGLKAALHISQAVLVALALLLTIGVFATSGSTDGRTGWFFGLCWLTIPILMYLVMVPRFPRTKRFGNIYAFAVLDAVSVILWLSAWAAVANYVVSGKGHGTVKDKTGCDNFKYGSAAKCAISETTIIFGVMIMLLFAATSFLSFQTIMEYRRTGILPDQTNTSNNAGIKTTGQHNNTNTLPTAADDEAFDSNMNLRNDWEVEQYDHEDYQDRYGAHIHGHDARQGGYSQAAMDEHGEDDYDHIQHSSAGGHNVGGALDLPGYNDDYNTHRPTSTGGPLGGDTSYHSGGYNSTGTYGR